MKTIVLERGRMTKRVIDYSTANLDLWDLPNEGHPTRETKEKKFKQNRTGYTKNEAYQHLLVDHMKHHFNEISCFDWM